MILACAIAFLACRQAEPKVTFELPNISLPQFSERLKAATGKSLTLRANLKNRSISIFVKDRKPAEVLAAIADTLDASLTASSDGWTLAEDRDRATLLRVYMLAEDRLLLAKNEEKVAALARLTQGQKPGTTDADEWAKQKIEVARYYAVGMWRRLNPRRPLIEASGYPHAFRITEPENDVVAKTRAAWIDSDSEKFAGTHVCFRVCPHTGELQVVKMAIRSFPMPSPLLPTNSRALGSRLSLPTGAGRDCRQIIRKRRRYPTYLQTPKSLLSESCRWETNSKKSTPDSGWILSQMRSAYQR